MNNILHKKVSNAPPLVRKKLEVRSQKSEVESQKTWDLALIVISKEERLRDLLNQSSEVTDSSPNKLGLGMTATGRGRLLLNLRDGPISIRLPIRDPDRERYVPAQTQNPFVRLCVFSVNSVVKINTTEQQLSTRQHKAISLLNTKDSPQELHGSSPHAGGAFLNSAMGIKQMCNRVCKKEESVQSPVKQLAKPSS